MIGIDFAHTPNPGPSRDWATLQMSCSVGWPPHNLWPVVRWRTTAAEGINSWMSAVLATRWHCMYSLFSYLLLTDTMAGFVDHGDHIPGQCWPSAAPVA